MWWGYSPALDILEEYEKASEDAGEETLRVLLAGCGDGRHQLRSLARRWRRRGADRAVEWHLAEPTLELAARHLLLQSVVLAPRHELGPRERARLYLELYGNTLVRAGTASFLSRRGAQLARCVADDEVLQLQLGTTLEAMRYRERDCVQDVCLMWRSPPPGLSLAALWEKRLRRALGTRYDSRSGVFDWDYHMRLRDLCGDAVPLRDYCHWRETGVAFTWSETECSRPNASLLSWVERAHGSLLHQGYCGDIESGPFPAFGALCDDDDMLRTVNGVRTRTATEVSERNLTRYFHELQHSEPYKPPPEEEQSGCVVITELPDARDDWGEEDGGDEEAGGEEVGGGDKRGRGAVPPLACRAPPRSLTRLLPPDSLVKYPDRPRLHASYHVVVIGQGLAHLVGRLAPLGRPGGLLLVEGRRWAVAVRKADVEAFGAKLVSDARDAGCEPVRPFDPLKHDVAAFKINGQQ